MKTYKIFFLLILSTCLVDCKRADISISSCNKDVKAKLINVPKIIKAGSQVSINIATQNLISEELILIWESKYGEYILPQKIKSETILFKFPDSLGQQSGMVDIKTVYCKKILDKKSFYIEALDATGKIESYLGPKTVAIDQILESMLCIIPTDQFGNALENNQPVSFSKKYNNLDILQEEQLTHNLLAYNFIENDKSVGKVIIGAKSIDALIDEQEIAIIQGPADGLKINVIQCHPYADQRQFVHLSTDIIYDNNLNVVADGTTVIFIVKEKEKVIATYNSFTVSGVARTYIKNPKIPTEWNITTNLSTSSETVKLKFDSNIKSIPLRMEDNELVVGPVKGSLDQYIADGTKVEVIFNDKYKRQGVIEHGYAKFELPEDINRNSELTCEVLIAGQKIKMIY